MNNIRKILKFTDKSDLRGFVVLVLLSIITILFETLSIGLVVPLVSIIIEPNFLTKYQDFQFIDSLPNFLFELEHQYLLFYILIGFAAIFFVKNLYIILYQYFAALYSNKLKAKLTNKLLNKYLCQNYLFHINRKYSNFVANLTTETSLLTNGILLPLLTLFTEVFLILGVFILILYFKLFKVILIFSIFTIIGIIILKLTKKYFRIWGSLREKEEKKRIESLNKLLSGIRDIILIGKKYSLLRKFSSSENNIATYSVKQSFLFGVPKYVFETMGIFGLVTSILFLNRMGSSTYEILTAASFFIAASYRIIPSLNKIVNSFLTIKFHVPVIDLLTKELSLKDDINFSDKKLNFVKEINISNISFKYPNTEKYIFKNASLNIKKGSIIGIIGRTGSGKSTLIDIISGLVQPQDGQFMIDSQNLTNPELIRNWQNNLSYVSQNTYLMDDSIKKNIAFGLDDDEINETKVKESIERSELSKFIENLPNKINTYVGDRGVSLSGGQIQRIGIARALYRNSEFLILDEITSALDIETEEKIIKNILNNKQKKTILFVTHNLSLLKHCEKVYKVENQKIIISKI